MSFHWGASIKGHVDTVTAFIPIATAPMTVGAHISASDLLTYVSLAAGLFSILWNACRFFEWIVSRIEKKDGGGNEP